MLRRFVLGALAVPPAIVALVALVAITAIVAIAPPRPAGAEVLNRVVLRVNDQIATLY